jgi:hypothetical protein
MERKNVSSSNLKSVGYLPRILEIEFKNRDIYQFQNVSEGLYFNLMSSSSKGTFFSENIKGKFPYKKIR